MNRRTAPLILLALASLSNAGPVDFGRRELSAALSASGKPNTRVTTELSGDPAESYRVEPQRSGSILIRGGDLRGLMYGLLEAAEQVRLNGKPKTAQGRPAMPIRGVRVFVHSESVERERTREYWLAFIQMLARQRFNRFNLVFAHQTDFMAPPYPYWVQVPGFESVRARGLSDERRASNLEMLRYISQTALDHGIDFTLGVWEHNIQSGMKPSVDGLTADNIGPFSHAALKMVLAACPAIRGVQMRTNIESGIPPERQVEFYRDYVFRAIREAGRPVNLEVRGWLMHKDLLDAAKNAGVPLRLSSKYWAEDMGRPYQPAETWPNYSYINFLERTETPPEAAPDTTALPMLALFPNQAKHVRPYDFYWEVWGLGSHRVLLWGDPAYVRRAVRTFTLADTQGFEIDPPLAQKGFGNAVAFDLSPKSWTYDFERYWMFYTLWGRIAFDPEAPERIWTSELERRFGAAAPDVLTAYSQASRVLNEIVAAHLADPNMYVWPEINPGGLIDAYREVRPSDWRYVARIDEAVTNRLQGIASAKQTPVETAARLHAMAAAVTEALERAKKNAGEGNAEWISTETDLRVLALLANYHARKMVAADNLTAYYMTGADAGLYGARRQLGAAALLWKQVVELTRDRFPAGMSFAPEDNGHWSDKLPYVEHDIRTLDERIAIYEKYGSFDRGFDFGGPVPARRGSSYRNDPYVLWNTVQPRFEHASAHTAFSVETGYGWVSQGTREAAAIPAASYRTVRAVAAQPRDLPQNTLFGDSVSGSGPEVFRVRTGEGRFRASILLPDGSAVDQEFTATNGHVDVTFPSGDWTASGLIIKRLDGEAAAAPQIWPERLPRPAVEHAAPVSASAGKPLTLTVRVSSRRVTGIRLHYRALNHLEKFRVLEQPGRTAVFTVPAEDLSPRFDLMYYFEILHDGSGGWFHPDPHEATPYFLLRVQ